MFNKILYTTDFSDESKRAFALATSIAATHQSKLFIVHVTETTVPVTVLPPASAATSLPPVVPTRDELSEQLNRITPGDPIVQYEQELLSGVAGNEIVSFTIDTAINLTVMSTHGRSGLERFLLGSVAEYVVRHATRPVLTCNAEFQ
ncbi:universal stress protein [Aeoliella sp.]|uniref:universal stress protein n=1 Tax=Aeoliella sp. TaxID=2795800 RepID=UPI003CCBEE15